MRLIKKGVLFTKLIKTLINDGALRGPCFKMPNGKSGTDNTTAIK